jgi:hypothetical protein
MAEYSTANHTDELKSGGDMCQGADAWTHEVRDPSITVSQTKRGTRRGPRFLSVDEAVIGISKG